METILNLSDSQASVFKTLLKIAFLGYDSAAVVAMKGMVVVLWRQ